MEPSRMEESTSSPPSTPSPTIIYLRVNLWRLTWTSAEIYGSIGPDGLDLLGNTLIPLPQPSFSTGRRILVWGKGSAGSLRRCLALACDERRRNIGGAIACWASPTEE